jgi:hypothetical protein
MLAGCASWNNRQRRYPANSRQNYLGHSKRLSLFMEVQQRYVINFFVEEGMKGVEIVDRLKKTLQW